MFDVGLDGVECSFAHHLDNSPPNNFAERQTRNRCVRLIGSEIARRSRLQHLIPGSGANLPQSARMEYNVDYRIVRARGDVRWIESRSFVSYDDGGQPRSIIGVNIDITERKRSEERQRALLAELDHRVKNALATVSAVISHTRQGSRSLANFAAVLDGRIRSMATTHELLSSGRWQGISLTEFIRPDLGPYAGRGNTEIHGPEVVLCPEVGQAMAMVLHELVTKTAVRRALYEKWVGSDQVGSGLNAQAQSALVLEWKEIDGPPVVETGKPSYGTSTIRDLIPYEFGGTVDLVLAPNGLSCRLELSSDWLTKDGAPASDAIASASSRRGKA
jgi:two-component sensor histidine kinase